MAEFIGLLDKKMEKVG